MNEEQDSRQNAREEDIKCVRAFQAAGDIAAFDTLVLRYRGRIFNLCYRFLGEYEEANDCAQETFLKVFRSLGSFRGDAAFATWVYRIAMNTCKTRVSSWDYRRKRKTVRPDDPDEDRDEMNSIPDRRASPDEAFRRSEKSRIVKEAIASLDEAHRTAVILRDIQGFSYEEIAGITGLNEGTVKSRIARAREALKEKLKDVI